MCLSPHNPSVTSWATSFTSATRKKVSPPSLKLLDLIIEHILYILSVPTLIDLHSSIHYLATNKLDGNPQSWVSILHCLWLPIISLRSLQQPHKKLSAITINMCDVIPIISYMMPHCGCTENRVSFNDFITASPERGDKSVHFYHPAWILIFGWWKHLKDEDWKKVFWETVKISWKWKWTILNISLIPTKFLQ